MCPDNGPSAWRLVGISALAEAARRGDRRVGTDHLLLGLLAASDGAAGVALGRDLEAARRALDALDEAALAAVGVRVDVACARATAGPLPARRPVLSSGARAVLLRAAELRQLPEPLGTEHILAALLDTQLPDPAAQLIDALRVDREQVRRHLVLVPERAAM